MTPELIRGSATGPLVDAFAGLLTSPLTGVSAQGPHDAFETAAGSGVLAADLDSIALHCAEGAIAVTWATEGLDSGLALADRATGRGLELPRFDLSERSPWAACVGHRLQAVYGAWAESGEPAARAPTLWAIRLHFDSNVDVVLAMVDEQLGVLADGLSVLDEATARDLRPDGSIDTAWGNVRPVITGSDLGPAQTSDTTAAVRFPAARRELLSALRALADLEYQRRVWIRRELPTPGYYDELDLEIHVLYDDTCVLPNPELCVGTVIRASEVEALRRLDGVLGPVIDELGNSADEDYLAHEDWTAVAAAAKDALVATERSEAAESSAALEPDDLAWIETWLGASTERHPAFEISTLDNPGWRVSIELPSALTLRGRIEVDELERWCHCWIDEETNRFEGAGSPNALLLMLSCFRNAVETDAVLAFCDPRGTPALLRLERWFEQRCDEEWEHGKGVSLLAGNGRWELTVGLADSEFDDERWRDAVLADGAIRPHLSANGLVWSDSAPLGSLELMLNRLTDCLRSGRA